MESLEYYIKYIGLEESHQINLLESDASGGNISRATIDKIAEAKDKYILTISGLRQDTATSFSLRRRLNYKAARVLCAKCR